MNDKQNSNSDASLYFIGLLAVVAVISQKIEQIKYWFYDHMMMLTFIAFVAIALIVCWVLNKMKKKEAELIARMRAVRSVAPTRNQNDYYKRRDE